jgi:hypothetical protein
VTDTVDTGINVRYAAVSDEVKVNDANTNLPHPPTWSRSIRVLIIDHLIMMDINISALIDVIEHDRYKVEIEELVEIVRALDILGAES